jgi:hypothetical protein
MVRDPVNWPGAIAMLLLACGACAEPVTVVHVTFTPPSGQVLDSISVQVSIIGSDGGVTAQKVATDTDAGFANAQLDLTVDVPHANLGLCVNHDPTGTDPTAIVLAFTYHLIGETQQRVGSASRGCHRRAIYETNVALAGQATWHLEDSTTQQTLNSVWADPRTGEAFAVGAAGTVLHTFGLRCTPQPDCAQWILQPTSTTQSLSAVWGLGASTVYAVGLGATLIQWDGNSWSPHPAARQIPGDASLLGVWASSPNDLYVVGQGATAAALYHFDGTAFSAFPINGAAPKTLRAVWGMSAADVYAVGVGTQNVFLENTGAGFGVCQMVQATPIGIGGSPRGAIGVGAGGIAWDLAPGCAPAVSGHEVHLNVDLHAVWVGTVAGNVFLVGTAGTILRGETFGAPTEGGPSLTSQDLNGISGADDGDIYAVGTAGTIVHRY